MPPHQPVPMIPTLTFCISPPPEDLDLRTLWPARPLLKCPAKPAGKLGFLLLKPVLLNIQMPVQDRNVPETIGAPRPWRERLRRQSGARSQAETRNSLHSLSHRSRCSGRTGKEAPGTVRDPRRLLPTTFRRRLWPPSHFWLAGRSTRSSFQQASGCRCLSSSVGAKAG